MNNNRYKIGVVTTSSPIDSLTNEVIEAGYTYLRDNNFEVFEHPVCRLVTGYTTGTISDRVDAIHDLVKDDSIDIIMAFWGGDNTNQILDKLDYELIKNNPKIFVGYSDTSSLLNAITKKTNMVTYLGPAVITFCKPNIFKESLEYFKKIAIEKEKLVEIIASKEYANDAYYKRDDDRRIILKNDGFKVFKKGNVSDKKIVAINLTMLQSLFGTEYEPDFTDKIFFCETDEAVEIETLDRMFVQLRQNGILNKISGLVFSKIMDETGITEEDLVKIFETNIKKDIPVIFDFDCGHTDPIITIPINGNCSIDTNAQSGLQIFISN